MSIILSRYGGAYNGEVGIWPTLYSYNAAPTPAGFDNTTPVASFNASTQYLGWRILSPVTANITAFHVFQRLNTDSTSPPGGVTGEIRNSFSTSDLIRPSSTVLSSASSSFLAADGWISFTGFSQAVTKNETFWCVIHSDDASASHRYRIQAVSIAHEYNLTGSATGPRRIVASLSTTNWSAQPPSFYPASGGTDYFTGGLIVVEFDDGTMSAIGDPYVEANGVGASDTFAQNDEVGLYLPAVPQDSSLAYLKWGTTGNSPSKVRIYTDGVAFGSPDVLDETLGTDGGHLGLHYFQPAVTLAANVAHRIVLKASANASTSPSFFRTAIGGGNDNIPAGGKLTMTPGYLTVGTVSNGQWNDYTTRTPMLMLGFIGLGGGSSSAVSLPVFFGKLFIKGG